MEWYKLFDLFRLKDLTNLIFSSSQKRSICLHTCATCSDIRHYIGTMESIGENSDCFYAQRILPSVFMYDFSCFFLILSLIKSVNSLFKGYSQILILNPFFMGLFHIIHLMRLHYRCHWSRMESSYYNRAFLLICFAILLTLALFMDNLLWLISYQFYQFTRLLSGPKKL